MHLITTHHCFPFHPVSAYDCPRCMRYTLTFVVDCGTGWDGGYQDSMVGFQYSESSHRNLSASFKFENEKIGVDG